MPRRHPHPYQRPPAVAPDPPRRAPRSGTGLVLKIALGVFIGGLALAAAAYFALAQPWKSAENCATNIAGQKMCGGDLLAFCERHYDPQVNGDACRPTLRDAGQDTAAVRRRVRRAEQVAIFGRKTTMSGALGDELWLSAPPDDLGVRITAHSSPPVGEYDEPSGDTRFVGVWYTLENQSDRTVTASPAQSITVIDTAGRQADPAVITGGECASSDQDVVLTPGDRRRGCMVVEVSYEASVARVQYDLSGSDGTDETIGQWRRVPASTGA
jgi:hypothetical protein